MGYSVWFIQDGLVRGDLGLYFRTIDLMPRRSLRDTAQATSLVGLQKIFTHSCLISSGLVPELSLSMERITRPNANVEVMIPMHYMVVN